MSCNSFTSAFGASGGGGGATLGANTFTGAQTISVNGAASTPPLSLTGTWFTGGSATTTKPQLLVEPTGATSTGWSTSGTGIGANAASGFTGNLLDLQLNGTSKLKVTYTGAIDATNATGQNVFAGAIQTRGNFNIFEGGGTWFYVANHGPGRGVYVGANQYYGFTNTNLDSGATVDLTLSRSASAVLAVLGNAAAGAGVELTEMTAPSAPASNKVRIYSEDNGSGKTRLMALFPTGAAQQIAIEP